MGYVLGLDLGTGSLKGVVANRQGALVAQASATYPLETPAPGYSEQNPEVWIQGAEQVLLELTAQLPDLGSRLEGISLSGQMHSLVLLDKNKQPLRNAILWNDVRTTAQCRQIEEILGEDLLPLTKNRALEGFTLPKLLWVKEQEPELWEKGETFLLPKDYLRLWLTGEIFMDLSDAAGTLLLDIENQRWSEEIFRRTEVPLTLAPPLLPSAGQAGTLRRELRETYGFTREVPVFAGGADNACAAVGAGILQDKVALCSIGTSGVFLTYEDDRRGTYDGKLHFFSHAVTDKAYSMGVTLSAGQSLSWFRKTFFPEKSYDQLLASVPDVPLGANGLRFTPYIMGERTPYADADVRGSFTGMDVSHTADDFARAVLEGITFSLKDCQQIMTEQAGKTIDKVISVGGGAKNPHWLQIQADIFATPVLTLEKEEGPAWGAAMIAAVGRGWFDGFQQCAQVFVRYKDRYQPRPEAVKAYGPIYESYRRIYPAIKNL